MKRKKRESAVAKEDKKLLFILNFAMIAMITLYLLVEFKYVMLDEPFASVFNVAYWIMIILTVYTIIKTESHSKKNKEIKTKKRRKIGK